MKQSVGSVGSVGSKALEARLNFLSTCAGMFNSTTQKLQTQVMLQQ